MKAIVTKYHGPTNTRGSRITATDEDGNRTTIPYPYQLSGEECHLAAAQALCDKMKWSGKLVGGSLKNAYVFVFTPDSALNEGEMAVDQKMFGNLIADRKRLLEALQLAVKYLDHPDVQAMNFAIPAKNVARSAHYAIKNAEAL